jgi:outer membrane protein TolC
MLQIGLERARLREREVMLEADRDDARYRIGQLLDRPAVEVDFVLDDSPLVLRELALDDEVRPEIAALDAVQAQADAEVALAQKAFYPDLGVGLTYFDIADRDAPPTADGTDAFAVSLSATIPLDRAGRRATLEAARLRQQQVEAERAALDARLQADRDREITRVAAAVETFALYRDQLLTQADAAVQSALAAYATGEADYPVVLEAERARFQVQVGLVDARFRLRSARARLDRAFGVTLASPAR